MKIRNPKVNQYSFLDNLIGEGHVWEAGKRCRYLASCWSALLVCQQNTGWDWNLCVHRAAVVPRTNGGVCVAGWYGAGRSVQWSMFVTTKHVKFGRIQIWTNERLSAIDQMQPDATRRLTDAKHRTACTTIESDESETGNKFVSPGLWCGWDYRVFTWKRSLNTKTLPNLRLSDCVIRLRTKCFFHIQPSK